MFVDWFATALRSAPVVLLTGAFAITFATDARAESKVAVVDVQSALMATEEGQRATTALKKQFDSLQRDLDATQADLAKVKDDIEKQTRLLSNEALRRRVENWQKRMTDLQTKFLEHNKSLQKKQNELTSPMVKKLMGIIGRIAKQKGYEIVIDRTAAPYARPDLDLTEQVVQMYNSGEGAESAEAKGAQ